MQDTMRAARIHPGEHTFRIEEVPVPQLEDGDVLVQVKATGLTRGVLSLWRSRGRMRVLPTILGYETAGVVAKIGPGVTSVNEGDRVRVHPVLSCHNCYYCRTDLEPMCPAVSVMGGAVYSDQAMPLYQKYHNGGLAEYIKVPAWNLDPLPGAISFEVGARIHSLAVAFHAIRIAQLNFGSTLVVNGATGGVGSAAVLCAPLFGVTRIIAISRKAETLAVTRNLVPGLVETIATGDLLEDWEARQLLTEHIRTLNNGQGIDGVVDFLPGMPNITVQSIFAMRKGGSAILAGGNYEELVFPYGRIMTNGYTIKGSNGYVRRDAQELIRLLQARRLDPSPLITHRFPLEEVNKAAETIWDRRGDVRFVIIHPNE
ncbi:MAG TPA: alcohol dehydrogenase catalytic domain-containing protein [Ktedonobacteraceae bacterium]|nr:alcohol dehydrogenase catalytic domain-containing protein [Ktedonobacteraceae bacterium]